MLDFDAWGLHGPLLLAGFSGGICSIGSLEERPKTWQAITNVMVSTLTANYLSAVASVYIFGHNAGAAAPAELVAAFFVGIGGPWVVRGIARKAKNWSIGGNLGAPK